MIQINPRIQPLKFLGSGPGSKIPCWSQSLRAVIFAAHFATPSGYYFECPARRTPLKWLKNFRPESVSFNEKKQEGTLALPKTGLRISTWRCSGGARDGINSILYHLWTRFWLFKKGLKQTLRHMWYLSLSLSIAISTGETDPGSGASTAATQQMGQPKAWKKTLLSQLYRQAEIKERISKNTVATLTYADINYWMVLVWPSDFLACSWKPRSSTHVSQHWGH